VRTDWKGNYYFLPLQVYCDSQLEHAEFENIEELIETVMEAFAAHAGAEVRLIIKHHPHDRGHRDYTRLIKALGRRLDCAERVHYVHDVHLPTLLRNACGTITMNSTVGLSSMFHNTPVMVLGRAIYHVPGLSSERSLAEFLKDAGELDVDLYRAFCRWLRDNNQLNGSYYKPMDVFGSRSGIQVPGTQPWPTVNVNPRAADLPVGESN
jgi:capsule polysaccharide modification protein KpsS